MGLIGAAGAGKDEVAQVLCDHFGYTRVAFADPVRQALLAIDPLIPSGRIVTETPETHPSHSMGVHSRLSSLVRLHGWEVAKRHYPEVRALLQRLGTDAIRTLDPSFWVEMGTYAGLTALGAGSAPVFTDTRFPNEVAMILDMGGAIIEVRRKDNPNKTAGHVSEEAWKGITPDHIIHNNGSLAELRTRAHFLATIISEESDNA